MAEEGKDLVIRVPVGTIMYNADSGEIIADLLQPWADDRDS